MITTGNVIEQGTQVFTPIIERILEIAGEFIPYLIYIAIGALGVSLLWKAVKYILGNLENKSKQTIREIKENDFDIKRNENMNYKDKKQYGIKSKEELYERNKHRDDNIRK